MYAVQSSFTIYSHLQYNILLCVRIPDIYLSNRMSLQSVMFNIHMCINLVIWSSVYYNLYQICNRLNCDYAHVAQWIERWH